MLKVKIKKLNENAVIPRYAKIGDAGMDIVATGKHHTNNNRVVYDTGLAVEVPEGHFMMLVPRSSIFKQDMYLTNHCGIVDSGYRGEIKFIFKMDGSHTFTYEVGDRIGQLIILPYPTVEFEEVTQLSESVRGDSGFGSSGI